MAISKDIGGKMFIFQLTSKHVTSQNGNCLSNMSTVLRVSPHIYVVSQEIDGKTNIFIVNLGL